jgi:hypothetical protein
MWGPVLDARPVSVGCDGQSGSGALRLLYFSLSLSFNTGLPWQKLHLTRRRIFLPANWT